MTGSNLQGGIAVDQYGKSISEWANTQNQAGLSSQLEAWRKSNPDPTPLPPVNAFERCNQVVKEINDLDKRVERLNEELRLLRTPDGAAMWNLVKGAKP